MGGGEHSPDERLTLRRATMEDLDAVLEVVHGALSEDPKFDYRMPYRDRYPEDHHKWLRLEYQEYLAQPEKYALMMMTASDYDDKPISICIWDYAMNEPHLGGDLGVPEDPNGEVLRKDVNPEHYRAWKEQITAGFIQYFYARYAMQQWHLWVLCTLPAFRGRGAATRLCKWGLERASKEGMVSTVLSTDPHGKRLYEKIGWQLQGSFAIRVGDEPECNVIYPMTYDP